MANPNIIDVTTIRGNTAVLNVTTVASNILVNSATSNSVFKVNTIVVSNIDGTNAADITAEFVRNGIGYRTVSTVAVPADASLVIVTKDTPLYLREGDSIRLIASANGDLQAICSYEEIS